MASSQSYVGNMPPRGSHQIRAACGDCRRFGSVSRLAPVCSALRMCSKASSNSPLRPKPMPGAGAANTSESLLRKPGAPPEAYFRYLPRPSDNEAPRRMGRRDFAANRRPRFARSSHRRAQCGCWDRMRPFDPPTPTADSAAARAWAGRTQLRKNPVNLALAWS